MEHLKRPLITREFKLIQMNKSVYGTKLQQRRKFRDSLQN